MKDIYAFPNSHEDCGMSLRDFFAAAALVGFIANDKLIQTSINQAIEQKATPEAIIAERCYKLSDAMLAERAKEPQP